MASKRVGNEVEQPNPETVYQRNTLSPYNSHDGAQPPSQSVNLESDAINDHLLTAHNEIETFRKKVLDRELAIQQALQKERNRLFDWSEAYKALNIKYGQALTDLHKVSTKCVTLLEQLDEATGTISSLEQEKLGTARKHESALARANDRISAAERMTYELKKQREEVMQKDQTAMADHELNQKRTQQELHDSNSKNHNLSPTIGKQGRPKKWPGTTPQEQSGPATRGRKRRHVDLEGDTIEVDEL